MRRIGTTTRLALVGATTTALGLGLAARTPVQAQASALQGWLRVDTVQVRPEKWVQFREIERDEVPPVLQKAGIASRAAWRTAEFGNTYEVMLVTPIRDFAFFDAGDMFGRVLDPRKAERLREKLRECIMSRQTTAIRQRTDLSVGEALRPFALVTTMAVAPGRGPKFEAFLRRTLPTMAKSGVVVGVYQRVLGAPAAWQIVENLDSLSELAFPGALERTFGQDEANRLTAGVAGVISSVERRAYRFDPELSFSFPVAEPSR
ncbi:MAG: hypothetical protein HY701_06780 [Gemmatimonadetes bacterium]|nr:hypothetical protein [Gemmatimonadota bacterium]